MESASRPARGADVHLRLEHPLAAAGRGVQRIQRQRGARHREYVRPAVAGSDDRARIARGQVGSAAPLLNARSDRSLARRARMFRQVWQWAAGAVAITVFAAAPASAQTAQCPGGRFLLLTNGKI